MDAAARDENGAAAALLFSGASNGATAALPRNDAGAAYLYYTGARDANKDDSGGAAYAFSGVRTAMTLIDGGAADLFPGARTAAPTKNGAPYMFSDVHVPTAAETKEDYAACVYPSVHADAASQATNGARPVIFPDVRAAAQNENVTVYIDDDKPAAAKNRRGAAAERGKGNVYFFELPRVPGFADWRGEMPPYPTKTTAAAVQPAAGYYNSGVVAGEALPLASQVFGAKTTSVPAVAVGQDKLAGTFTERLRRWLPVLGLSLASLAVAGLAAGEHATPAAGFGLFLMLIVGLSTVTIRALRD